MSLIAGEILHNLKSVNDKTVLGYSIRNAASQAADTHDAEDIFRFIRSQALDNYGLMQSVIGSKLLTQIIES